MQQSLLTMRNFFMGTEREPHGGVARAETWAKDDDNDLTLLLEWLHCSRFEDKGDIARCVAAFELGVMYHLGGLRDLAMLRFANCCMDLNGEDGEEEVVAVIELVCGGDLMGKGCDEKVTALRKTLLEDGEVENLGRESMDMLGKKVPGFLVISPRGGTKSEGLKAESFMGVRSLL